ncbi:MAG TPA: class II aldolase/adducin family protein, partial [Usitatibacter sp.]
MSPGERGLRVRLVAAARRMSAQGLSHGKSGNVSARSASGFVITPSGKSYETMGVADLVSVDGQGNAQGPAKPSSEWRLHRDLYAR